MVERRLSFTQAQCEACWIERNSEWESRGIEDVLLSIRRPVVLVSEESRIEQCAFCGRPTIVGIYVRVDPATVAYPRFDDEDDEDSPVVKGP